MIRLREVPSSNSLCWPRRKAVVLRPLLESWMVIAAFLLVATLAVQPAWGVEYSVTTLAESGGGSLSEAIANADATLADDVITFNVAGAIDLSTPLPAVAAIATGGKLTIDGGGVITIDGGSSVRIITVATGGHLILKNLSIDHGSDPSGGGGVYNNGVLEVSRCTFTGDQSHNGMGGAIYNNQGSVTVSDSTFAANTSASIVGFGGALYNTSGGTFTIEKSLFSGNSAYFGGAAYNSGGTLTIVDSTFSGNMATETGGEGGAIYSPTGTVKISNSTFVGNDAAIGGGDLYIGATGAAAEVSIRNSIVASNSGFDCTLVAGSTFTASGSNFDVDGTCTALALAYFTTSPNLHLGGLADNGGPTETIALLAGSVAIDAVSAGECTDVDGGAVSTDQRGIPRPQDGDGNGTPRCDAGAFEASPGVVAIPGLNAVGLAFLALLLAAGALALLRRS